MGLNAIKGKVNCIFFGSAALFDGHQNDGHLHLDIRPNMYCVHYVMFTLGNESPIRGGTNLKLLITRHF